MNPCFKSRIIILLLCIWPAGCGETNVDPQVAELYRQGNQLYEQGQFEEAGRTYERILQRDVENGNVYYNLGNAYFKQQKIGKAILAYERARRLLPRDEDIQTNLTVANLKIKDRITSTPPGIGQRLLNTFTVNECTVTTSLLGGLTAISFLGFILSRSTGTRRLLLRLGMGFSLVFILGGTVTAIKIYTLMTHQEGVVMQSSVAILSSPDENSDTLFILHEGTKTEIVEARNTWLRIQLPDGKNGWITQEKLDII